jgi:hypothetical protein
LSEYFRDRPLGQSVLLENKQSRERFQNNHLRTDIHLERLISWAVLFLAHRLAVGFEITAFPFSIEFAASTSGRIFIL